MNDMVYLCGCDSRQVLKINGCVVLAHKQPFIFKTCLKQATHPPMSKTEATDFVAAGSLLPGFANGMGWVP